jgi:hypothetical protein
MSATLADIRTKVRRLTRSPAPAQITNSEIDTYVNTFILYDFPEHLRLFSLRKTFSFFTNPGQDRYPTDKASFAGVITNPLYNFQNRYVTTQMPVYIAGVESVWSQSREEFYRMYPLTNSIQNIATGDGITATFSGIVPGTNGNAGGVALLQNNVLFSSINTVGGGLALVDVPVIDIFTGNPSLVGNLYDPSALPPLPPTVVDPANNINYMTGAFTLTFASAPGASATISSQTVPQQLALPNSMLYYENTFFLRPVPDKPYRINIEVEVLPTELLQAGDEPNLNQWWQYIAYGASKKIFEDRTDSDSVQLLMPEFKQQERLVLRTTIAQIKKERTSTIYGQQSGIGTMNNGWGWNNF